MITLFNGEPLPCFSSASFMQTACLISAFEGSPLAADIWVQRVCGRICAVISRQGGRLNITAENPDFAELKDFISIIGFTEIFCEKSVAEGLGFKGFSEFTVLKAAFSKSGKPQKDISLSSLYSALKWGEDGDVELPPFEIFAPDTSHRLRHGGAAAVLEEYGAALGFKCSFGGIISGISVKKEHRGLGLGGKLLKELCGLIGGEIFVCTSKGGADFYIKNGFNKCDTAVILRGQDERIF